jgi:hypothetical protein
MPMAKPQSISLPPDVFEAVVRALAEALVAEYPRGLSAAYTPWKDPVGKWRLWSVIMPVVCGVARCLLRLQPNHEFHTAILDR